MSDRCFQVPFPISREMACSPHFVQVHTASKACPLKFKSVPDREQASFICAKHQTDQPGQPGQCLTFVEICLKLPRDAFTNANLVVADIIQAIPSHVVRNQLQNLSRQTVIRYCKCHESFPVVQIALPYLLNCPRRSSLNTTLCPKRSLGKLHCLREQLIEGMKSDWPGRNSRVHSAIFTRQFYQLRTSHVQKQTDFLLSASSLLLLKWLCLGPAKSAWPRFCTVEVRADVAGLGRAVAQMEQS